MPTRPTTRAPIHSRYPSHNAISAVRPAVLGLARLLGVSVSAVAAAPLAATFEHGGGHDPDDLGTPVWVLYVASAILVLLGGAFAGLTIAIYLQVISSDKDEPQHNNARRVYKLLESGKHWVLVTLLLSNVIVNESLPVVLDRCLGGGVAAVVGSTALIVIFGEVVPQSVCVRYGLQIGGYMSKPVLALMWLTAPLSWPTAKLLDWILGEDHGTVYKKSGLKTLVTLHRSLGVASERLNRDEVTIISAVLDLKEKPVAAVMTPMDDVFVMSEDTVLDEPTMDRILSAGYSRIPIHEAGSPTNFLGMLLVKILITYDPEDCMLVKDFPLATLPETRPETSCLDIVNYFQEGKSHMVLVSDSPGNPYGALGVVTLEDVIEELIGEEIIDESDVYVDVHKAIRRLHPAPNAQVFRRHSLNVNPKPAENNKAEENSNGLASPHQTPVDVASASKADASQLSASPKATFLMRRSSAGVDGKMVQSAVPVRANIDDIREHLRHLGPSNPANNPKNTRLTSVTIKPGHGAVGPQRSFQSEVTRATPDIEVHQPNDDHEDGDNETTSLLHAVPTNGRNIHRVSSKDGVQALRRSYGALSATEAQQRVLDASPPGFTEAQRNHATHSPKLNTTSDNKATSNPKAPPSDGSGGSPTSDDRGSRPTTPLLKRSTVRSGSITENIFESRGFRKVVLETTSSNDDEEDSAGAGHGGVGGLNGGSASEPNLLGGRGSSSLHKSVSDVDEETDDEGAHSAADQATGPGGQNGASSNDAGKKKNRRKKRKGRS
ncbi:hypothetical protein RB599_005902 [Gaeumannomyces hyphopodioides]